MQIVMRTPCTFHAHCDETAVYFWHGHSAKDEHPTEADWDKMCCVCEGVMSKIRESILKTGKWTCPKCGFVHTADVANHGPITPKLSFWYKALQASKG